MIYYGVQATAAPGGYPKVKELCAPYAKLLKANGAKSVQSFVVSAGQNVGTIAHLIGFADRDAAGKAGEALRANSELTKLQERGGPVIASLTINTLQELD